MNGTQHLAARIRGKKDEIASWLEAISQGLQPPIVCSVDLRDASFKIAPIDTNLFPSGFNNLCNTFSRKATRILAEYMKRWYPTVKRILIWPEEHTRNLFYLQNVRHLQGIFEAAGFPVVVANRGDGFSESPYEVRLPAGHGLILERAERRGTTLTVRNVVPNLVLLNNDLSDGVPDLLQGIEQPIIPPPGLGWWNRRKSDHLAHYGRLAEELASILDVDPWTLILASAVVPNVSLDQKTSLTRLADAAASILEATRREYKQRGIGDEPFVYVKHNAGTYGLGMTYVGKSSELTEMSRKNRKRLGESKGGNVAEEFIVQEGIPTCDFYGEWPMEPVFYLVGGRFAGGFFRHNARKDRRGNLNSPGMTFSCLCFHRLDEDHPPRRVVVEGKEDLFAVAELLAQVACAAAALEMKDYSA